MSVSHSVVTICLILDGLLVVAQLNVVRRPAVPTAAVPPAARRWWRLVLGGQAIVALVAVAAFMLLLLRGVAIAPSEVWSVVGTLFFLLVVTAARLARAGRIVSARLASAGGMVGVIAGRDRRQGRGGDA